MKATHWFRLTLKESSLLKNWKSEACTLWITHLHLSHSLKLCRVTSSNSEVIGEVYMWFESHELSMLPGRCHKCLCWIMSQAWMRNSHHAAADESAPSYAGGRSWAAVATYILNFINDFRNKFHKSYLLSSRWY